MNEREIAIIHPRLKPGGGSEARALWIAEALKKDYQVTLVSMGNIDLEALNQYYDTNLKYDEISIIEIPIPKLLKRRFDALRSYRLSRYCKKNSDRFDLMISTCNVMDFGKRGIQFIADFSFDDDLRRKYDFESGKSYKILYQKTLLRRLYINFSKWISGESSEGWMKNITVANSKWSSELLKRNYGINAGVIYPPVEEKFPDIQWGKKGNGFVAIGRLVPEKKFDQIINILKKVREKGHDIHFHIIGGVSNTSYYKKLLSIARENSSWCSLEGPKYGKDKKMFLSEHKYGISGRKNEPFGIAVAEMIKAGCIVWVPEGGGQVEIVDHPDLIYKSEKDAVAKIEKILKKNKKQKELLKHLQNQSKKFSTYAFMLEVKSLVSEFFERNEKEIQ
jgi:glycosyltransferase involved in cell wall biosynthesis